MQSTNLVTIGPDADLRAVAEKLTELVLDHNQRIGITKIENDPWSKYIGFGAGLSGTPTDTSYYIRRGKDVTVELVLSGTSNSTSFSCLVPFISARAMTLGPILVQDSGGARAWTGTVTLDGTTTTGVLRLTPDAASTGWTNTGTKSARGVFTYEAK